MQIVQVYDPNHDIEEYIKVGRIPAINECILYEIAGNRCRLKVIAVDHCWDEKTECVAIVHVKFQEW